MPRDWPDPRFDKPFSWLETAMTLVMAVLMLAGIVSLTSFITGLLRQLFE